MKFCSDVAGKNLGPLAAHREKDCNHSSNGCNPITTAWPLYGHPRRHTCMSAKKTPNFNCQGWDTFVIQPCQLKSNTSAKIQVAIQSPEPGRSQGPLLDFHHQDSGCLSDIRLAPTLRGNLKVDTSLISYRAASLATV